MAPPLDHGIFQDFRIAYALFSLARLIDRQYVVTKSTKLFDHWERKVLVGKEPGHRSGLLVFENLEVDLGAV